MTIYSQANCKAAKDLLEIMAIASAMGFLADCVWIVVEIRQYGAHASKLFIALFLHMALLAQMYALVRFHRNLTQVLVDNIIIEKKNNCIIKARIGRKLAAAKQRGNLA